MRRIIFKLLLVIAFIVAFYMHVSSRIEAKRALETMATNSERITRAILVLQNDVAMLQVASSENQTAKYGVLSLPQQVLADSAQEADKKN